MAVVGETTVAAVYATLVSTMFNLSPSVTRSADEVRGRWCDHTDRSFSAADYSPSLRQRPFKKTLHPFQSSRWAPELTRKSTIFKWQVTSNLRLPYPWQIPKQGTVNHSFPYLWAASTRLTPIHYDLATFRRAGLAWPQNAPSSAVVTVPSSSSYCK